MNFLTLGSRIQEFREDKGLSQQDFAELLDVSRITVLRWETNTSKPSVTLAKKLEELGFGKIDRAETKHNSTARIDLITDEDTDLRSAIRAELIIGGKQVQFTPSSYVINGPTNQIGFFEILYSLQEKNLNGMSDEEYMSRLALVATLDISDGSFEPAQHALEKPSNKRKSWDSNYGSHGWHRYIGRFPPHVVRAIINHFGIRKGDIILDPFAGSGTTLVEARLLGIDVIGIEISPLSSLISRAKSHFPQKIDALQNTLNSIEQHYFEVWEQFVAGRDINKIDHDEILERPGNAIPKFANIEKWFTPKALLGVSIIVQYAASLSGYERDLVLCALSAKMRSIGNVDVDVVRAEYRKTPRSDVDVFKLFRQAYNKMLKDIKKMNNTHQSLMDKNTTIEIIEGSVLKTNLAPKSIDYIITSPPYGVEAVSYLRTHLLSYRSLQPLLEYDPYESNEDIIGSEYVNDVITDEPSFLSSSLSTTFVDFFYSELATETSKKVQKRRLMMMAFFDDMAKLAERFQLWLKPGGRIAFVVGNKKIGNYLIPTAKIIAEIFSSKGLQLDEDISHKLKTNNSNSEVPWQAKIIQDEFIMLFTKRDTN